MAKVYKCKDCGNEFNQRDKGCKLVSRPYTSYPLCPKCVTLNEVVYCENCDKYFKLKEGWLDECWICEKL